MFSITNNNLVNPLIKFNKNDLIPKKETQALSFLNKNPSYNGRNIKVAILDTGIDPGARGLRITPEGKPKIIDVIDCTGSGDVKMIKEVSLKKGEELIGLLGKRLIINEDWDIDYNAPILLGIKDLAELYPQELLNRVKKTKFEKIKSEAEINISKIMEKLDILKKSSETVDDSSDSKDLKKDSKTKELEAKIELYKNLIKQFEEEFKFIVDVVSFKTLHNDSKGIDRFSVVVDWGQEGKICDQTPITDYKFIQQYWKVNYDIFPYDYANVSVKIYQDGKLLSLVIPAGMHGSHVAGIVAAHYDDLDSEEDLVDGVAPGAQIVSLKIGDTRLKSLETQAGLNRALSALIEHKCDLANMSYGEPAKLPDNGRIVKKWLEEFVIRTSGCIFVSSAGNEGPALSTVGCPGGTTSDIIGVGAYVTHPMMKTEYSALKYSNEMAYTWCSRGPTTDGDIGVNIYAPGGAISTVPTFTLQPSQLANGTSMSSPNLCGCLALILSGLKDQKIKYTTYRIKTAIENTSSPLPIPESQQEIKNAGVIQVEKAFDYLVKYKGLGELDSKLAIAVTNRENSRGVYLREPNDSKSKFFAQINIKPEFNTMDSTFMKGMLNDSKYKYEQYLSLNTTSSFIRAPEAIVVNSSGRDFVVEIDPTVFEEDTLNYGEIQAHDMNNIGKGPVFRIPVTVIKPKTLSTPYYSIRNISLQPGSLIRRFINVPSDATSCRATISSKSNASYPIKLMVHFVQILKNERFTHNEHQYLFGFEKESSESIHSSGIQTFTRAFQVRPSTTLEMCIAQWWATPGSQNFDIELEFSGLYLNNQEFYNTNDKHANLLTIRETEYINQADIVSKLKRETRIKPVIEFHTIAQPSKPSKAEISTMKHGRNTMPNGQTLYQLVADFEFRVKDNKEVVEIELGYPRLVQQLLYDNMVDSFFVVILDGFNKPVGFDEVTPRTHKLKRKGTYTIKLQFCDTDIALLEKIKELLSIEIYTKLPKDMIVKITEFYKKPYEVINRVKQPSLNYITLDKGDVVPLYFNSSSQTSKVKVDYQYLIGDFYLKKEIMAQSKIRILNCLYSKAQSAETSSKLNLIAYEKEKDAEYEANSKLHAYKNIKDEYTRLGKLMSIYPDIEAINKHCKNNLSNKVFVSYMINLLDPCIRLIVINKKPIESEICEFINSKIAIFKDSCNFDSTINLFSIKNDKNKELKDTIELIEKIYLYEYYTNIESMNYDHSDTLVEKLKTISERSRIPEHNEFVFLTEIHHMKRNKKLALAYNRINKYLNTFDYDGSKESFVRVEKLRKIQADVLEKIGVSESLRKSFETNVAFELFNHDLKHEVTLG